MEAILSWIYILAPVFLLLLGLIAGQITERRHFRNLTEREHRLSAMTVTNLKTFAGSVDTSLTPYLVNVEVVIASDYMKSFLTGIRKIFGGEMRAYEKIVVRARREVLLRLKEQAAENGCNALCNLRLETADIGGGTKRRGAAMVEVLASATAYRIATNQSA